jgi:hypothetical protein
VPSGSDDGSAECDSLAVSGVRWRKLGGFLRPSSTRLQG